ncbi:MAG: PQQ-dependent sugar dehydrogenase [Verrucomicrobiota bacterium]
MNKFAVARWSGKAKARVRALAFAWFPLSAAIAGTPGLDAPVAIGPFLNQSLPEAEPTGANQWSVQETYTGININLPMHIMPYPGTNKLLCVAKEGRIFLFDDNAAATVADTFLDLRSQVFASSDCGMTWLVCHPEFGQAASPNRDYVYITYKWKPAGGDGHQAYWRLSRFTVILQSGKPVANPASEQILIQQYDRQEWHDSGCMMFGPDGYLYIGIGDEGGANDEYNDGQKINDRLFSGILRIDVDQKPASHAIRRQPAQLTMPAGWPNSFTANYKIPADNPFNDISGAKLEEFYAMGLRNPYRFSYDPVSNRTWIGDVGQDSREEIDILTIGGNYGWPFREGAIARPTGPQPPVVPSPLIGTLTAPVWDSPHGTDGCVVGGFVYRGAAHPSLTGEFISVDNVNSHIRAHTLNGSVATNTILTAMPSGTVYSGTSTIGRDLAGEPIFVKINGTGTRGRFFKLVGTPIGGGPPPALLSQTGAFSDLATLTPSPGVVPYTVNAPLWSDAAGKRRWIAVPNNGVHDTAAEKITFAPEANWTFPAGTVFIKHFELPVDDSNPTILRRLETRFLIIPTSGEPYGLTYRWRADGSEADLLPGGFSEAIDITTSTGGTRQQIWEYPSRGDCRICHNGNVDYVLGVKTQQLNGNFTYPLTGRTANQLETLGSLGWFDTTYRADLVPWMLQSHHLAENAASLTERVRSYIDSNCSQCHQPGGVRALFDARYTTALEEQGLINGAVESDLGDPANRVIVPGSPANSIMLTRLASLDALKMPPLAKHLLDPAAVALLTEWINTLGTGPSVTLSIGSAPTGPFTLNVHFSQAVTGLAQGDFELTGATSSSLTGSGADYVLSVVPAGFGVVTVKLPSNRVVNAGNVGNYASALFSRDIVDQSLVAWLKLDDAGTTAADSSSYGNHGGTLVSMTSANWVAGHLGGGLAFTATDQSVSMQNYLGADFSISFWMKTTGVFPVTTNAAQGTALFNADVGGAANDFVVAGTRESANGVNRISFQTGIAGGSNIALHGTTAVNDGQWKHIVVTRARTSGVIKIYVNGALDGSGTGTTALLTANPTLTIGAVPGSTANTFSGTLDDIRMFTTVLGNPEIDVLGAGPAPAPPYSQWVQSWLPGIYHLQGPDLDPEGDGLTNFGEFAFGGDPLGNEVIPSPLERAADGSVTLSYRARKAPAGAVYGVRVSGDLAQWLDAAPNITSTVIQDIPATDYQWVTVTYLPPPAAGPNLYFRIQATP